jgi:hypothetical protein
LLRNVIKGFGLGTNSLKRVLFAMYNQNDQVKYDKVGREYSTHEVDEKCIQGFGWESQKERDH